MALFVSCMLFMVLVFLITSHTHGQTIRQINRLRSRLLKRYNDEIIPVANRSGRYDQMRVDVDIYLKALGGIDEVNEMLSTSIVFHLQWNDANIKWEPTKHHNITNITMDANDMWKPYMKIMNKHHSKSKKTNTLPKIHYTPKGTASWLQRRILRTRCEINTLYFPFDVHRCKIELNVPGGHKIIMMPLILNTDDIYDQDGAWRITDAVAVGGGKNITITYELTRKPLFLMLNILCPILLLCFLSPLVFLLPNEVKGRAAFSVSTLLAISVYRTIIADNLPKQAYPLPLVSVMLFVWYVINSTVVFIVVVNKYMLMMPADKRVPNPLRLFVSAFRCLRLICGMPKHPKSEKAVPETSDTHADTISWEDVCETVDLVCVNVIYIIFVVYMGVMIWQWKNGQLKYQ